MAEARHEAQPSGRDHGERALGSGHQRRPVDADGLLRQTRERADGRPVGEHRLDPHDLLSHRAVAHDPGSAGVRGDRPADAGRVACGEVDRRVEPGVSGRALPVGDRHPRVAGDLHRRGVQSGDAVEATHRQHDRRAALGVAGSRHAAADEAGVARLGHDGDAEAGARSQDLAHLGGGPGPHDGDATAAVPAGPVGFVARPLVGLDEHVPVADDRGRGVYELGVPVHHRSVARPRAGRLLSRGPACERPEVIWR